MKPIYIQSYAHANSIGITPCDSIISAVIDPKNLKTILACRISHGITHQDGVKYAPKMHRYEGITEDSEGNEDTTSVYATSPQTARIILNELIPCNYRLIKYVTKITEYKRRN